MSNDTTKDAPAWKYTEEFGISKRLKDVLKVTLKVTEAEQEALRRKLEKLTYGG